MTVRYSDTDYAVQILEGRGVGAGKGQGSGDRGQDGEEKRTDVQGGEFVC